MFKNYISPNLRNNIFEKDFFIKKLHHVHIKGYVEVVFLLDKSLIYVANEKVDDFILSELFLTIIESGAGMVSDFKI